MTLKQGEILQFIKDFAKKNGILPTYEEICKGVGLASKSSVYNHILHLINQGQIVKWGEKRYSVKGLKYIEEDDIKPPS